MKAEISLSRPSYRAGNPVVGTIRIHHDDIPVSISAQHDVVDGSARLQQARAPPIRQTIVSARLYLAGRAHLGSSARDKSSRWRSSHEVNQLKNIYGEHHPCLSMAMTDEQSRWNEWNDGVENRAASGSIDYVDDIMETFDSNDDPPRRTSFCQKIQPPQVSHIEQAERLTVHSCLHHHSVIPSSSAEQSDNSSGGNQPSNDFSHLPAPHENNVVCLWMTNVLELLDLPERHLDRKCMCANEQNCKCQLRPGRGKFYGDMHPYRPLQLPDLSVVNEIWKDMENKMSDSLYSEKVSNDDPNHGASPKSQSAWSRIVESANHHPDPATPTNPIEQHQLAFSFRANLPPDIPPTMSAECVKYFYSVVLVVTTVDGKVGLVRLCLPFIVSVSSPMQFAAPCLTLPIHGPHIRLTAFQPTAIITTNLSNTSTYWKSMRHRPLDCSAYLHYIHRSIERHFV